VEEIEAALGELDLDGIGDKTASPDGDGSASGESQAEPIVSKVPVDAVSEDEFNAEIERLEDKDALADAQARLDEAIEAERQLKAAFDAAKEATKAARRERDEVIRAQDRKRKGEAASVPLKVQIREAIEKYSGRSSPEVKKANRRARAQRHRDRIKADPVRAEEQRRKDAERKKKQYHRRKHSP
jgi:hypothetical protein